MPHISFYVAREGDLSMEIVSLNNLSASENCFIQALFRLIEKKDFKEISIKELAKAADYDRKTFYRHFDSKEDILNLYFSSILEEMVITLNTKGTLTWESGILSYFEFWKNHLTFLSVLEKNNLLTIFAQQYDKMLYTHVGTNVQSDLPKELEMVPLFSRCSFYFTYGGLWNVLLWWVREAPQLTPTELTDYVLTCFQESVKMMKKNMS